MHTHKMHQQSANHCLKYMQDVHKYHAPRLYRLQPQRLNFNPIMSSDYLSLGNIISTSTLRCAASTRLPAVAALHQLRRTPRLLISRSHGFYIIYAVRRDYSSSGLHQLYCAYVVHPDVPSRRLTSRRSVALALTMHPITASRSTTTHRPDCTSSTAPILCIRTSRIDARLLVGRSHWLSLCVRSLRLATRLLVVEIAPALLCLCRASGRAVSTLDFSSVGRIGSRRVPSHSIVCRDNPSHGCNRYTSPRTGSSSTTSPMPHVRVPHHVARLVSPLVVDYFAYAAHPGASARRAACHAARC
jgi:hypothetical protein